MGQISRKGTIHTQLQASFAGFEREGKKVRSTLLTEKRADNILLDLDQIKSRNAKELKQLTNRHETLVPRPPDASEGIELSCSQSLDFRMMLRELDNL